MYRSLSWTISYPLDNSTIYLQTLFLLLVLGDTEEHKCNKYVKFATIANLCYCCELSVGEKNSGCPVMFYWYCCFQD